MPIKNHKELIVWQQSLDLVSQTYKLTNKLPRSEEFILISQALRSAISIPSNIAEGFGRNRKLEFIRFLNISYGSACELETQLLIIQKEYPQTSVTELLETLYGIEKMLRKLISKIGSTNY